MKIITAPAIAAVLLLIVCVVVHPVGADWVRIAVMEQDPQDNNAPKEGTSSSTPSTWHDSFRQLFAPWFAKNQVVEHSEDAEFEVNNGEDNHDEEWLAAEHYEDEEEPAVVMPRRGLAYGYSGRTYHSGYRNGGGRTSSYNGNNGYSYTSSGSYGRGGGYGRSSSYSGGYGRNSYDNDNYSDRYGDNDRYEYNGGRSSYHNGRYGSRGYSYDGYGRDNDRV